MINKVKQWLIENNTDCPKGITLEDIAVISRELKNIHDVEIPQQYAKFLTLVNGFSYDSYNVYCFVNEDIKKNHKYMIPNDFLYRNKLFIDSSDLTEFVILGESSIDYIAYDISREKYVIMTNGLLKIIKEYDDFDLMLLDFLGLS